MPVKIFSVTNTGLKCQIVEVEAEVSGGLPCFNIVGLADASVQEARERVRSSLKNAGLVYPASHKTINLAPAQLRKKGAGFDLPIALALLIASKQINGRIFDKAVVFGELSLTGEVKRINGALALTQEAKRSGFKRVFLPEANAEEASYIGGIEVFGVRSLADLISFIKGKSKLRVKRNQEPPLAQKSAKALSLDNIKGLTLAKRAMAIAATGGHNVLLVGPPGTGKTVLARAFKGILPTMTREELLETTKIHSVAGLTSQEKPLVLERPFRELHHSATMVAVIGGGARCARPGEITLAHNGVLFLDELTEFKRVVLEALRQPLEDKFVTLNRFDHSEKLPADFILLATMNPCPCGYHQSSKQCRCSESQIKRYQRKLSGPIRDRFDIFLHVPLIQLSDIYQQQNQSSPTQDKVGLARQTQLSRYSKEISINKNADLDLKGIQKYCRIPPEAERHLQRSARKLKLSNRAYLKTIKLARSIADFEGLKKIEIKHLDEALQYRVDFLA